MKVVALAGNPNCGKTSLFNRLTGLRHRVGNYPGVTVERRSGRARLETGPVEVVDLPGAYSLVARSRDESIAFEVLTGRGGEARPDLVVVVVDASNLLRNLFFALSVMELGCPVVVALNMVDLARDRGLSIDVERLEKELKVPVAPIVARTGEGVEDLAKRLERALQKPPAPVERVWKASETVEDLLAALRPGLPGASPDGTAIWLATSAAAARSEGTPLAEALPPDLVAVTPQLSSSLAATPELAEAVIEARYAEARRITDCVLGPDQGHDPRRTLTDRLDSVFLHPVGGIAVFLLVMAALFQSVFAWAEPLMGLIEDGVGLGQTAVRSVLPEGALADLAADGVVGGVGNVLVFVPQIAFLFAFIALLEDSGYLARAAFISDRFMARAGLHGRAFVPLLSGFACAVPAIMATRTIESRRDRLVTILVTPLVSCSARLPIYTVLIASLFAADELVFGLFSVGGLMMLGLYLASIVFTVGVAFVLKRTVLRSPTPPLVLELPPYRRPELKSILTRVYDRSAVFVKDAGTVILACSIVLWALLYFPSQVPESFELEAKQGQIRAELEGEAEAEALAHLDEAAEAARIENSIAGRAGKALEPAFRPLGYDWKMVVGIISSFAAREVFVSTLGLVYGMGAEVDEESVPLREKLQSEVDPETGRPRYTPLVALSLMAFFLLALQCMSTVAAIKRETASWRWPLFAVGYASALAWLVAFVVYQGGLLLGFE